MQLKLAIPLFLCLVIIFERASSALPQKCPDGSVIYEWGISEAGKIEVVDEHNRVRQMVLNGQVPNQPRGKNIKMMTFDTNLSKEGRKVSQTCKFAHGLASDQRWSWVGQNLYAHYSSANKPGQDWSRAVNAWFNEHKNFIYPNSSTGVVGHYTQVVWDSSNQLGCDFIKYFDNTKPRTPYAKVYTCNYGPGGNYRGKAPYQLA